MPERYAPFYKQHAQKAVQPPVRSDVLRPRSDELISTSKLAARNRANAILEAQEALNLSEEEKEAVRARALAAMNEGKKEKKPWYDFSEVPTWDFTLDPTLKKGVQTGLVELGKDLTPVEGQRRSAIRSAEEFKKAREAYEKGNYLKMLESGIWSGLESADVGLSSLGALGAMAAAPIDVARAVKRVKDSPVFTSPAVKAVKEIKQNKMPPNQWISQMSSRGVSKDELYWTGVEDWLKSKEGSVTKQELDEYLGANQIQVQEVVYGQADPKAKELLVKGNVADGLTLLMENDEYLYEMSDEIQTLIERYRTGDETVKAELDELFQSYAREGESMIDAATRVELEDMALNPQATEIIAGGETKFGRQVLPGGENYRELLLTLPGKKMVDPVKRYDELNDIAARRILTDAEQAEMLAIERQQFNQESGTVGTDFVSGHYDEPNVIAHIRFNERTDADGKKVLFIEEYQSDWAHKGQDVGFLTKEKEEIQNLIKEKNDIVERGALYMNDQGGTSFKLDPRDHERYNELSQILDEIPSEIMYQSHKGVPSGPFVMDTHQWTALSLKRMVRWAADNDFDSIAWTTGKQQADRYNLRKHLDVVKIKRRADDSGYLVTGSKKGVQQNATHDVKSLDKLDNVIGKELADKTRKDMDILEKGGDLSRKNWTAHVASVGDRTFPGNWHVYDEQKTYLGAVKADSAEEAMQKTHGRTEYDGVTYSGVDLELGGDYVKFIYDKVLPAQAKKLGKKYGAKVETSSVLKQSLRPVTHGKGRFKILVENDYYFVDPSTNHVMTFPDKEGAIAAIKRNEKENQVWSMDLTDKLKKAAKDGLPYYVVLPPIAAGVASQAEAEAADVKRSAGEEATGLKGAPDWRIIKRALEEEDAPETEPFQFPGNPLEDAFKTYEGARNVIPPILNEKNRKQNSDDFLTQLGKPIKERNNQMAQIQGRQIARRLAS